MSKNQDLIDTYIATWNETDPARRLALIERIWAADGRYADPLQSGEGAAGIDAMIAGLQAHYPGLGMRRSGAVDGHGDFVRFGWELGPDSGPAVAGGVDFGVLVDGRLHSITGFFDFAPAPAQA